MPFWSADYKGDGTDPKRNFRFYVQLTEASGGEDIIWWAKEVSKPSFTVNIAEHSYLNHKFKFPGTVTWNDVELTVVDPQDVDAAGLLSDLWQRSGYTIPSAGTATALSTVSKSRAVSAMGDVIIAQVNAEGGVIEKWTLANAMCKGITYGDTIAYGNDELTTYKLSIAYDYASMVGSNTPGPFFGTSS